MTDHDLIPQDTLDQWGAHLEEWGTLDNLAATRLLDAYVAQRDRANCATAALKGALADLKQLHDVAASERSTRAGARLGYVVLSKTEDRLVPGTYTYTPTGAVTDSVLPALQRTAERPKRQRRFVVAELREVSHDHRGRTFGAMG